MAQTPPAPAPVVQTYATISGVVLQAGSNTPLNRAYVTLSTMEAVPQDALAWTDAQGRFAFGYLAPGRYQLRVQKNGFESSAFGATSANQPAGIITLTAGENRADFLFRLQPTGSISGVVLDEDGDPIPGANVNILFSNRQRRRPFLGQRNGGSTDSRGQYRISNLPPGHYIVMAQSYQGVVPKAQSEVSAANQPPLGQPPPQYSYAAQFYPGTDSRASAVPVTVQAGKDTESINFRLSIAPALQFEGRLIPPPGAEVGSKTISVNMVNDDLPMNNVGSGAQAPDYVFHFFGVRPGRYKLVAQTSGEGHNYRGVQELEVTSQPPANVTIPLLPGVTISGKVMVEGPDASKHPVKTISLSPGDNLMLNGLQPVAKVQEDGAFTFQDVLPGVWDISVNPIAPGSFLKAMRLGNQDVLTEEMVITSATTAPLNIVVSTRGAVVQGEVPKGEQATRSVVLLAPDGKYQDVESFYRFITTDEKGHFEMNGLTPGRYKLYAMQEFDRKYIEDPELLRPLDRFGVAVELKEGQTVSQKLALIPHAAEGMQ